MNAQSSLKLHRAFRMSRFWRTLSFSGMRRPSGSHSQSWRHHAASPTLTQRPRPVRLLDALYRQPPVQGGPETDRLRRRHVADGCRWTQDPRCRLLALARQCRALPQGNRRSRATPGGNTRLFLTVSDEPSTCLSGRGAYCRDGAGRAGPCFLHELRLGIRRFRHSRSRLLTIMRAASQGVSASSGANAAIMAPVSAGLPSAA